MKAKTIEFQHHIGGQRVNVPIPVPVAYHSFGDHHIDGMKGLGFYTKLKTMTSRRPSGIRTGAGFHFVRGLEN